MGMSFIGSYSGIDQSTIDQLMEAERMPLKSLANKKTSITEKQNAWKDVNTRLNSLFERMKELKNTSSFNTKTVTSTNENYVSMEAGNSAAEGRYNINIEQLASNVTMVGAKVDNAVDVDGKLKALGVAGKFSITNSDQESVSSTIEVEASDTLRNIVDKINDKTKNETGISASIVDGRIVLADEKTGNRSIKLENIEAGSVVEALSLDKDSMDADTASGAGVKNGSVAKFTLNGIAIESDINRVAGVVDGIVINLNQAHPKDSQAVDVVTIASDTEKAAKAVQDFVDQYNSTMKFIEEKTAAGDPEIPGSKGSLAGESSLIRLQTSLRSMVTGSLNVEGSSIGDASQIGVSTVDRFGELKFDKSKFLEELGKDKDNVMNFFNPKDGQGLVDKVNDYIDGFISKSNGIIKSKNESFEKSLKDLTARIESFEERMVRKEAYYVKTFTALDVAMMKAEDQMGWLMGQVDAMNGGGRR